jgi:hypothetical protein
VKVSNRVSGWITTRAYDRDSRYLVVETKPTSKSSATHSYVIPREPLNLEVS